MASDKTVLVTGATGLLGRQVVRAFGVAGWNVKGAAMSRADGVTTLSVNLLDEGAVAKALDDTKLVFLDSTCSTYVKDAS
jgi:NAD(P)-dependent dehydrogenase (short-subunit alcohol dehydrogenase family)